MNNIPKTTKAFPLEHVLKKEKGYKAYTLFGTVSYKSVLILIGERPDYDFTNSKHLAYTY